MQQGGSLRKEIAYFFAKCNFCKKGLRQRSPDLFTIVCALFCIVPKIQQKKLVRGYYSGNLHQQISFKNPKILKFSCLLLTDLPLTKLYAKYQLNKMNYLRPRNIIPGY